MAAIAARDEGAAMARLNDHLRPGAAGIRFDDAPPAAGMLRAALRGVS